MTRNIQKPLNNEQSINASYRGESDGHQLGIDASYADYNSSQNQDISNYVESILDGRLRNNMDSRVKIKSAQFDYIFKLGKGKAEMGAKIAETHSYNNLKFDTLSKDGIWVDNTSSISYSFRDINTSISYRKDINIESQVPLLDSTTNII